MKKLFFILSALVFALSLSACDIENRNTSSAKESREVDAQQDQYAKAQPIPKFNWSFEREMVSNLYKLRNQKVATHSVWRSDHGVIEGDCASLAFGIPYDTSLTNPLTQDRRTWSGVTGSTFAVVEQPEPNGIFASKNTSATWVLCIGPSGGIEPIYVETKVTVYPYPVTVDYDKNRVLKAGKSTVDLATQQ